MSKLIDNARKYLGKPYFFGADPEDDSSFDCSSFTYRCFKDTYDIDLPRQSIDQEKQGTSIPHGNEKEEDLMFFDTLNKGKVSHVGIVTGIDPVKQKPIMIHANSVNNKVVEEVLSGKYWEDTYISTKRMTSVIKEVQPEVASEIVVSFADINNDNYPFYQAIAYFAKKKAINAGPTVAFFPHNNFTRAEFAKVLCNILGFTPKEDASVFFDTINHWCNKYAAVLKKKGIIRGYEDGSFKPDRYISWAELCKMVIESYKLPKKSSPSFNGIDSSHWFYNYQGILKEKNLIPINTDPFPVDAKVSRGNALEFMYRVEKLES